MFEILVLHVKILHDVVSNEIFHVSCLKPSLPIPNPIAEYHISKPHIFRLRTPVFDFEKGSTKPIIIAHNLPMLASKSQTFSYSENLSYAENIP